MLLLLLLRRQVLPDVDGVVVPRQRSQIGVDGGGGKVSAGGGVEETVLV